MFYTVAGIPAGYGYFTIPSIADENIMPAVKQHLLDNDLNNAGAPIQIGSMAIQVQTDAAVSINGRAPIWVQPDIGLSFDIRGMHSLSFTTAGILYNIVMSY